MYDCIRGRGCNKCSKTKQKTNEEFILQIPKDYEALEPYINAYDKILIRHKSCGFIWKISPHNLLTGKGCPQCNRKISKGEQKIINFLKNNNINYVHQYAIKREDNNSTLYFDFYLPDNDLFIEYQGIQHYKPVEYFGGQEGFQKQIENDEYKRRHFKNLLTISYENFNNIDEILKFVLKL